MACQQDLATSVLSKWSKLLLTDSEASDTLGETSGIIPNNRKPGGDFVEASVCRLGLFR